jgi:hypothetical protein
VEKFSISVSLTYFYDPNITKLERISVIAFVFVNILKKGLRILSIHAHELMPSDLTARIIIQNRYGRLT